MPPAPVSAIVTAYRRPDETVRTLSTIAGCVPPPAEIIVHIDGNNRECADAIRSAHPDVRILTSDGLVGPGGARNRMVEISSQPFVASFDDDSYPMDADFFARVSDLFAGVPDAWVIGGKVYHPHQPVSPPQPVGEWSADFSGGGCAYRRERYRDVGGYVPIPDAYNMEEVDFALRLHAKGGRILGTPWLRVFHNTDLARHSDPGVTAASIANLALLAFLRYPVYLWTIGVAQCVNRIQWLLRHNRWRGIGRGLADIPVRLWRHRDRRKPLPGSAVRSYFALRRHPVPAPLAQAIARVNA